MAALTQLAAYADALHEDTLRRASTTTPSGGGALGYEVQTGADEASTQGGSRVQSRGEDLQPVAHGLGTLSWFAHGLALEDAASTSHEACTTERCGARAGCSEAPGEASSGMQGVWSLAWGAPPARRGAEPAAGSGAESGQSAAGSGEAASAVPSRMWRPDTVGELRALNRGVEGRCEVEVSDGTVFNFRTTEWPVGAGAEEGCVESDGNGGAGLRAVASQTELPALVFLHGFLGSGDEWGSCMAALSARGFRCVALDLPGHGGTITTPSGNAAELPSYSLENVGDAVAAAITTLGLQGCTVVGYSLGARVALWLALRRSRHVARAVVVSGSPGLQAR
ncbi:hypothetical protein CYMTET_33939, partial [Cymbomonas tetramitiformis]